MQYGDLQLAARSYATNKVALAGISQLHLESWWCSPDNLQCVQPHAEWPQEILNAFKAVLVMKRLQVWTLVYTRHAMRWQSSSPASPYAAL